MNLSISRRISLLPLLALSFLALPVVHTLAAPAPQKAVKLAPVSRKAGNIVGRAVKVNGSPIPAFTVNYSGFEKGKLATMYGGNIYETLNKSAKATGGRYAIKVPPGAYRASGYVTYQYKGRVYNFDMELAAPAPKYDYQSSQLEELRGGLIRNFVLKMQEMRAGGSDESESLYRMAYYGGIVNLDCRQYDAILGGGNMPSKPLRDVYPGDSQILLTLTPNGPRVDGSVGQVVNATLPLGDDGKWTFMVRGVFPGVYSATAKLKLADGTVKPLKISNRAARTVLNPGGYDRVVFDRGASATVDFLPNDLGPRPCMGVKAVQLYLGE